MLRNTFRHVPGIGAATEKMLWEAGIIHWDDFSLVRPVRLPQGRKELLQCYLEESGTHIQNNNPAYFTRLLPAHLHWRLFPEFRHACAYLDIETTGLDRYEHVITAISLYDGRTITSFVRGRNLDDFPKALQAFSVLVTYNGKCFDVPFVERAFNIRLEHAHIDLRYVLGGLGLKGGLKKSEKALGIDRGDLADIDGFFAVVLWQDYLHNHNPRALETLLAYNMTDVVNLERLLVLAYNRKLRGTPFSRTHRLPVPAVPEIPYTADRETIERLKRSCYPLHAAE